MRKTLKKYFIPHEENEYKPHFWKSKITVSLGAAIIAIEALFLLYVAGIFPSSNFLANIIANVLVDGANENRITQNIGTLKMNPVLSSAAQEKAEDMAAKGYFAHTSPEGRTPWYWFSKNGYTYGYAGENLAIHFTDSKEVTEAWMNSPGHRANILNNKFTEIGIGIAHGVYNGQETTFVVQLFGRPAGQNVVAAVNAPVPTTVSIVQKEANAQTKQQELFIAVQGAEVEQANAAGEEVMQKETPKATVLEKIATSPKESVNTIYMVLGMLIAIALLLVVFIEIRVQHPSVIASGITLILIISGVLALNHFVILSNAQVF